MALELSTFDALARAMLTRELSHWRSLVFGDLLSLVGMRGQTCIDAADELSLEVAVRWSDDRDDRIRVTVGVEALLEYSRCRLVESIEVLRSAAPT